MLLAPAAFFSALLIGLVAVLADHRFSVPRLAMTVAPTVTGFPAMVAARSRRASPVAANSKQSRMPLAPTSRCAQLPLAQKSRCGEAHGQGADLSCLRRLISFGSAIRQILAS